MPFKPNFINVKPRSPPSRVIIRVMIGFYVAIKNRLHTNMLRLWGLRIWGLELTWPAVVIEDVGSGLPTRGRALPPVSDECHELWA